VEYYFWLGVDHAYVYTMIPLNHLSGSGGGLTVVSMTWASSTSLHQRGQNWQINDCVHRAAADGFDWSLSVDLDEALMFAGADSLPSPWIPWSWKWIPWRRKPPGSVKAFLQRKRFHPDVYTFGSDLTTEPADYERYKLVGAHRGVTTCLVKNLTSGVLANRQVGAKEVCVGWQGRRKALMQTRRVFVANIHFTRQCRTGRVLRRCNVEDLDTETAWLLHSNRNVGKYEHGCSTCPAVMTFA